MRRRIRTTALAAALLLAAPATAYAVSASSADGDGNQTITSSDYNQINLTGSLRSAAGQPVYFDGFAVRNIIADEHFGRYTSNTSSLSYVTRGGSVYSNDIDGVRISVCRDRTALPDPCGNWSATMWK